MIASTEIIELIKSFEGFSSKVYLCPAGLETIGYGHVITAVEKFKIINKENAEKLLKQDVYKAEVLVIRNIHINLTQSQFDALISFTFNLGGAALQRSTLRQKVNRNDHMQVPKELMRWVCSNGQVLPGLIRRRSLESNLYMLNLTDY